MACTRISLLRMGTAEEKVSNEKTSQFVVVDEQIDDVERDGGLGEQHHAEKDETIEARLGNERIQVDRSPSADENAEHDDHVPQKAQITPGDSVALLGLRRC